MLNRLAITALALSVAVPVMAADKPYRVSLIGDGFDGTSWHTGVQIDLAPGWKTYWRMPGDSGIPPEFTWTPSHPARVEVQFPTPSRHVDKGGEAIGYLGQVLFPVTVTPDKPGGLDLNLDLFFAVCKDVCVPAQAQASIALGADGRDPLGSLRAETARASVPTPGDAVTEARIVSVDGKPVLHLALKERPEDIFVESATSAYFGAPAFAEDGHAARLPIGSLGDAAKLKDQPLVVTYILGGKGHEQTLTLP
jgi:DsbC/DsbD-like thiol-disulfide interchange protein